MSWHHDDFAGRMPGSDALAQGLPDAALGEPASIAYRGLGSGPASGGSHRGYDVGPRGYDTPGMPQKRCACRTPPPEDHRACYCCCKEIEILGPRKPGTALDSNNPSDYFDTLRGAPAPDVGAMFAFAIHLEYFGSTEAICDCAYEWLEQDSTGKRWTINGKSHRGDIDLLHPPPGTEFSPPTAAAVQDVKIHISMTQSDCGCEPPRKRKCTIILPDSPRLVNARSQIMPVQTRKRIAIRVRGCQECDPPRECVGEVHQVIAVGPGGQIKANRITAIGFSNLPVQDLPKRGKVNAQQWILP